MAPETLSREQLNRATLARQMLLARERSSAVAAVQRLAGMQAQEPRHPFTGLWTRVEGFSRGDLLGALRSHEVVRAPAMRSTLHLMGAADFAAVRMALQPSRPVALRVLGARAEGLDLDAVLPAARSLLAGGALRFDEIRARLQEEFPGVNDRALGYAVRTLVPLVMVPDGSSSDGWGFPRVASFALAEQLVGAPLARDGAAVALVERYLGAFGPASAKDVQAWSGAGGMKEVLDAMRDRLVVFADERGRELFDLPDAPRPAPGVPAPVRFLPEFDNLVLAWDDRTRVIADEHRPRLTTKNLRVRATFLVDGFVRGTWTVAVKRKVATLELEPFERVPAPALKALSREGEALLRFLEPDAAAFGVRVA